MKPKLTVALPTKDVAPIIWLALEGLARQRRAPPWELLIFEENEGLPDLDVNDMRERLAGAGCVDVRHMVHTGPLALHRKWVEMANEARADVFVLQAADCYPYETRLLDTAEAFGSGLASWADQRLGFFYQIDDDALAVYDHELRPDRGGTALNMAVPTRLVAGQTPLDINKGVDRALRDGLGVEPYCKGIASIDRWETGLDTDGLNTITRARRRMIRELAPPFRSAQDGERLRLPAYVMGRLSCLRDQ